MSDDDELAILIYYLRYWWLPWHFFGESGSPWHKEVDDHPQGRYYEDYLFNVFFFFSKRPNCDFV